MVFYIKGPVSVYDNFSFVVSQMDQEAEEMLRKKMGQVFVVPSDELRALTQRKVQYLNTLKL